MHHGTRELFRLSEDEAAIIQLYRALPDHAKAALHTLTSIQAESLKQDACNVYQFLRRPNVSD